MLGRKLAWGLSLASLGACAFDLPEPQAPHDDETNDADGGGGGAEGGKKTDAATADEGGASEAGTQLEAGGEGCPNGALLCEDFDTHGLTGWSQVASTGTVTLGSGRAGNGLVASMPARDGSSRLSAVIERTFTLPARTPFTVAYDLMVSAVQNVGVVDLHFFSVKSQYYELGLRFADYGAHSFVHDYGDSVGGGGTVGDDFAIEPVVPATWTRVALTVTYPPGSVHARVTYDGVSKWQDDIPAGNYNSTTRFLSLGIGSTERAGNAITVTIDNLVVTSP